MKGLFYGAEDSSSAGSLLTAWVWGTNREFSASQWTPLSPSLNRNHRVQFEIRLQMLTMMSRAIRSGANSRTPSDTLAVSFS